MSCYLGYQGPNPPRGETHHYQFRQDTLYYVLMI
jgi:phosphatidylethanolamine-binding protein (PEBP) family uncharacterized protein